MSIQEKDLKKMAELSKIDISEEDFEDFELKLKNIIKLVDELNTVNVKGVEPMAHPLDQKQILRKDDITEKNQIKEIERSAPEIKNSHYIVPKFVE
ncbi:MAG: aspartyl/glutamyl-tRNA(Asn/Gln) amidotransferase subunit C [Gammaproteobacteria bacterium TMED78]|nr:MAG: aspartyl/glutamyl-tRNA(Asn/Gln) amidotransferase subunit C [Gammaproteobacteria bacterium TMED78]|tara:strand:- start:49 stop:336 length:288 start_codon:yes stop_codon:yes gene_type:complete